MSSRSDAPLLSGADHRDSDHDGEAGPEVGPLHADHDTTADADDPLARKSSAEPPGLFVWLLVVSAGLSGLLFGCANKPPVP